jgi:hypothetical protein
MARQSKRAPDDNASIAVERVDLQPAPAPSIRRSAITVGSVNDPAEAEADRLADRALSLAASYGTPAAGAAASAAIVDGGRVQRSAASGIDGLSVDSSAISAARSGGASLDDATRSKLEAGFGTDLGAVRVHTGPQAAGIARDIQARAFTHGNDVFFGKGEYRPDTPDGQHVLAHEVAHTVQNSGSGDTAHRFPATWNTSPVPWGPMTSSVFRPGEGASGGVYILTSNDNAGPVKKAVVKPVFGSNALGKETGQQLQFSDVALAKLLGLRAPESKIVKGGSEFKDLVNVCKPHQPAPLPGETVQQLADAESFVVMSEVPNGTSIASLADKAPTNKQASADLYRTVFDPMFLSELGRLCIGDLMLGNQDRIVLGAMNLGNVMLSMQDGRGQLAAIDTTAKLPKAVAPKDWVGAGGSIGGFNTNKSAMAKGPGDVLDGFFEVLVSRLENGTPADAGSNPTWQLIQTVYKNNRDRFLSDFDYGWNDALITALSLADDQKRLDSLTEGYDDEDVTSSTLKANLAYLGAHAEGKSHGESIGRSIAITASAWVSSLDSARLVPSGSDELAAKQVGVPTGKVIDAEVVPMPSLPLGKHFTYLANGHGGPLSERDYASFDKFATRITNARGEISQSVSATKERRSKPFGPKVALPRNRGVVSEYVVHSAAMAAGGSRMADAAAYTARLAEDAQPLLTADYRGNEAAPVKQFLTRLGASVPVLATEITAYRRQLTQAVATIPKTKHGDAKALAAAITNIDVYLDKAVEGLSAVKDMKLQRMAAAIKAQPR